MGIFVEHAHITVRRSGIQIEIAFLDIFAVIALVAGEAEQAFLEDGVLAIPHGEGKADQLMAIADATDAVFSPAIGPCVGLIEGKGFPRRAVGAVVLADRTPLAFGKVGSPAFPVFFALAGFFETMIFGGEESGHVRGSLGIREYRQKRVTRKNLSSHHCRTLSSREWRDCRVWQGRGISEKKCGVLR